MSIDDLGYTVLSGYVPSSFSSTILSTINVPPMGECQFIYVGRENVVRTCFRRLLDGGTLEISTYHTVAYVTGHL